VIVQETACTNRNLMRAGKKTNGAAIARGGVIGELAVRDLGRAAIDLQRSVRISVKRRALDGQLTEPREMTLHSGR
jgi:hypothetical protein